MATWRRCPSIQTAERGVTATMDEPQIKEVLKHRLAVGLIAEVFGNTQPRWVAELINCGVSRETLERVANALIAELSS